MKIDVIEKIEIKDLIPNQGFVQRYHCDDCSGQLELEFVEYDKEISSIRISISGFPVLTCLKCCKEYLPDLSRFTLLDYHKRCLSDDSNKFSRIRRKRKNDFGFTEVGFLYDPDDYFYIPGLYRQHDIGFLTPVYFNIEVLFKFDNLPEYQVEYASRTYGTIYTDDDYISFGINKNGRVIMWLGDIAKLPNSEQYYLRSENVDSDHSLASEFYDGQIECKPTDLSIEDKLFKARFEFFGGMLNKFKCKLAHLDKEVMAVARNLNAPIVDTPKERRHIADAMNKIYLESIDNKALSGLLKNYGIKVEASGSLKRLQALFETFFPNEINSKIFMPFYVLYDLRVAYSHLTSADKATKIVKSVEERLGLIESSTLLDVYLKLTNELTITYSKMTELMERENISVE